MSKHTPGPWEIDDELFIVKANDYNYVIAEPLAGNLIGNVEELRANARLIAAAPETAAERDRLKEVNAELLAALKRVDELWTRSIPGGPDHDCLSLTTGFSVFMHPEAVALWRQARATITKAEKKS